MANVIIGTAGHVDHGKTTLIKALTGVETDRLKEEKERGITIESGFAYFTLDSGERCGIIDVPGHEKFIRNMLSGAGSVDLALFVVAADEGIMPQSREHLDILTLLDIKRGIIALTKCDTVENDWLDMVIADIKSEFSGTFLENAPLIPVSAKTGCGIDRLKQELSQMIEKSAENSRDSAPMRLPIDRVFSKEGFGTVVTGTLTDGTMSVGDEFTLFPSMTSVRARNLQVHSAAVEVAKRGQRVAVNLAGAKVGGIEKGCTLAAANSMELSTLIDVRLDIIKGTSRKIASGNRLHFYYGTAELMTKVFLVGVSEVGAGGSCYAQFKLEEPIAVRAGDRFVVRFYSPLETVGGGIILDPNSAKKPSNCALEPFIIKEKGNLGEKIACFIEERSKFFPKLARLKINPFLNCGGFDGEINRLLDEKKIFLVKESVIGAKYLALMSEKARQILQEFHAKNPLVEGMNKEEFRSKLLSKPIISFADELLNLMENGKIIRVSGNFVADFGFKSSFSAGHIRLSGEILELLNGGGFSPLSVDEIAAKFSREGRQFKEAFNALVAGGKVVLLTRDIAFSGEVFANALDILAKFEGEFTLGQVRDTLNSSRKYVVALLEYCDAKGLTKKIGDTRTLKK